VCSSDLTGDADVLAFFARVNAAGGTLTLTEESAIYALVSQLKVDGIWNSMKAIYPMVGASAAACAQNLKSSSFTGSFTSGWTFAATGVTPNGTNAYMDTGLNDNANLSLNSAHLSIYSRTNSDGLFCDIGISITDPNEINIFSKFVNVFYPRIHNTNIGVANTVSSLGLFISNRVTSSQVRAFQNNTLGIITNPSNGKNNANIFIGAANNGTVGRFFANRQYAFASIGDGLTDTQASDLYTAVQAFQTTLSRQV
jgi:hypothetical protein